MPAGSTHSPFSASWAGLLHEGTSSPARGNPRLFRSGPGSIWCPWAAHNFGATRDVGCLADSRSLPPCPCSGRSLRRCLEALGSTALGSGNSHFLRFALHSCGIRGAVAGSHHAHWRCPLARRLDRFGPASEVIQQVRLKPKSSHLRVKPGFRVVVGKRSRSPVVGIVEIGMLVP